MSSASLRFGWSLFFITATASFAQIGTASLSGLVSDPSGAAIPNAAIALQSATQAFRLDIKTGATGEYVLPSVPPGTYRLTTSASGFREQSSGAFELSSGQAATLNVNLKLAGSETTVTVEAEAPVIQTTSASLGTVVSSREMTELPLLGGSFLNALVVAPGVAPVPPAGSTTSFSPVSQSTLPSVFGQRQKDNIYTIDGVDNRDPDLLGIPLYPPPEAVAEMKVDSGVGSSVYGRASGATVNIVTKSGSNRWHAALWEDFRNNDIDARSFFSGSVSPYHYNQFGFDFGGPFQIPRLLKKEKAWYIFGYYEGVRIRNAANFTALLPTAANLTGNFAGFSPIFDPYTTAAGSTGALVRQPYSGNAIPKSQINASTLTLAQALFPLPNLAAGVIPGANYLNPAVNSQNGDQWNVRLDHQFGRRDNFFVRYTDADNPSQTQGLPSLSTDTSARLTNFIVSDTHVFNPTFLVTGRFGLNRITYRQLTSPPQGLVEQSGINAAYPAFDGYPLIPPTTITGYGGISFAAALYGPQYVSSYTGDAQKVRGEHTIEFGGGLMRTQIHDDNITQSAVQFAATQTSNFVGGTGDALASFLLGAPASASRLVGSAAGDVSSNAYSLYLQDTWRHRHLSVNLGLRYEYASVPVNHDGLGTFVYDTGTYVWDKTNPINGAAPTVHSGGLTPRKKNFMPRAGFAYQITPRTVVRSSFGFFYDTFGSGYIQAAESARGNWPFSFPQSLTGMNPGVPNALFPNPFPSQPQGSTTPLVCGQCLNLNPSSSRTPYVAEWTLSLQREVIRDFAVEAAYFGSHAVHLVGQIIDNTAVVPGPGAITLRQLYPQFAPYVLNGYNEFPSWYEGASLRVNKRFSHGLTFLLSYTFSKNLDVVNNLSNASLGGAPTSNPTRYQRNKGPAGFDIPNMLVFSGSWSIPGRTGNRLADQALAGWRLSGISSAYSGLPFMLFLATDNENIGTVSGRSTELPNLVGDPSVASPNPSRWFNTAAFAVPAPYTAGNAGRNILRTGTLVNTDLSVSKRWRFLESRDFEARVDLFNAFNHPNFGYPGGTLGTAQFGKVANTRTGGRIVEIVLKLHF